MFLKNNNSLAKADMTETLQMIMTQRTETQN